jgi:CheY-like chemotaxis protein
LIVLDNTLSNVSAGEILTKLKKNPNYGDIPVVIYSTSVSKLKTKELLDMGAYAAIEKGQVMSEVIEVAKRFKAIAEQK